MSQSLTADHLPESSGNRRQSEIRLPDDLQSKLLDYRGRVWKTKILEAIAVAVCCLLIAWLAVLALDRLFDTPSWMRGSALAIMLCGIALIPFGIYRWVWRRRTLPQVARLICRKLPGPGDRLLGVLDLVSDKDEQSRSPVLCKAAVAQVATEARSWDLSEGVPSARNGLRWKQAGILAAVLAICGVLAPAAVTSAWARLTSPWGDAARYTFAALGDLPQEQIVAHGEPFQFTVPLAETTRMKPSQGVLTVGRQTPVKATLADGEYVFEVPSQIDDGTMKLKIGDARRDVVVKPTMRPELESVFADITLPGYLKREGVREQDVRGGAISLVKGSQLRVRGKVNRELASASVNGNDCKPNGADFKSGLTVVDVDREIEMNWKDNLNLESKEPFKISVKAADDAAPTVSVTGLQRQMVVLVSEQVSFQFGARDDFGVSEVGIQWQGYKYDGTPSSTKGSRVLAAGGPKRETLNASGSFNAMGLGIEPQAVEVQVYVKDLYPDREPAVSPSFFLYVLSPDDHAVWLTEQLNKWHRRALEVRDRELKLYADNERIRNMSREELNSAEAREDIERQVRAEKAQSRRLGDLTNSGDELIKHAMKNEEFGVGHLEKWAEMLNVLKDISANRMPSVANLLQDAAEAPKVASKSQPKPEGPKAGESKAPPIAGAPTEEEPDENAAPAVPKIVVDESSEQKFDTDELANAEPQKKKAGNATLKLPENTMMGKPKAGEACPAGDSMDEAVEAQKDLLAEFEKVADELNNILANLEGSTLVKRLKSASRKQFKISGSISDMIEEAFGKRIAKKQVEPVVNEESVAAKDISYIMDDMQAYFDRRPMARFRNVLDEMRDTDILGSLRKLGDDIPKEAGVSIAQCEYWGDTMDRWAEDLVDPAGGGT